MTRNILVRPRAPNVPASVSTRPIPTAEELAAMALIKEGADIYAYGIAKTLRAIERNHPELIDIGKPMQYQGDGTDRMPYFGAILTYEGVSVLEKATKASSPTPSK